MDGALKYLDLVDALASWLVTQGQRHGGGSGAQRGPDDETALSGARAACSGGSGGAVRCRGMRRHLGAEAARLGRRACAQPRTRAPSPPPAAQPLPADEAPVDLWLATSCAHVLINSVHTRSFPNLLPALVPSADEALVDLWLTSVGVLARSLAKDGCQPLRDSALMALG